MITSANSLVGNHTYDNVAESITALTNGNYVVCSSSWSNGTITFTGAATWANGAIGLTGVVSSTNSLIGSALTDQVGDQCTALTNGNYVVGSKGWNNGTGAATWGNGLSGVTGVVSSANSLVGDQTGELVGYNITALKNGNYVVSDPWWDNGNTKDVGVVTWGNGASGVKGVVSSSNSLVGSQDSDLIGYDIIALNDGNYVVESPSWANGGIGRAGAVTWEKGDISVTGIISPANSLVGSSNTDIIGEMVTPLKDGSYVVWSQYWHSGALAVGAVSWGDHAIPLIGPINANNSVLGQAANGGASLVFDYDAVNHQLVVGRPAENVVTLFRFPQVYLPVITR